MEKNTNKTERCTEFAARTLLVFQQYTGSDPEDSLCDLLADLMHWSDCYAFDFDFELQRARDHYTQEVGEAANLQEV